MEDFIQQSFHLITSKLTLTSNIVSSIKLLMIYCIATSSPIFCTGRAWTAEVRRNTSRIHFWLRLSKYKMRSGIVLGDTVGRSPSKEEIRWFFVEQYYKTLCNEPTKLYAFHYAERKTRNTKYTKCFFDEGIITYIFLRHQVQSHIKAICGFVSAQESPINDIRRGACCHS